MTDEGQTGLADFGPGGDDADADRPEEEAVYVAGDEGDAEVVDPTTATLPDAEGTVEMTVTQVDYTVAGYGDEEEPLIHVFGRRADRTGEHVVVRGFEPYFYAPTDTVDEEDLAARDRVTGYEEGYESIRGEELTKVFGQTPRDVGQMRDDFQHYEADVLFPNRFLIDKDIGGGLAVPNRRLEDGRILVDHEEVESAEASDVPPRMNVFDIEVDDRSGFPEEGEEPIVCLTSHDSYRDEYVVWLFEAPDGEGPIPEELPDYDPLDDDADYQVRAFDTEEAMLDAFLSYVEETDPSILSGWNFEDFDAPYLLDRLEVLQSSAHDHDLSVERLSRVGEVWRGGWGGPDVKGRVVFDLLRAYKRTQFSELESYRLDAVGEAELGVGKERYAGDIGDLWEDDPERLLEYNLRDVELCVELDRKQDIVQFWMEVKAFVGCLLEDAPTPGDAVDMYVMHEAHDQFVLPSKGQQEAGEEFEGGAVFEPITGVREMVSVLDLKCFSADTDLLTPDGTRRITDVEVGDEVYTLNPETFECEVTEVAETHTYDNQFGELHHLSGNTHDFKITENHRFLASKARGWDDQTPEDFEFAEYRDLTDTERYAFPQHDPMDGATPETFDLLGEVDGGYVVAYSDEDLRVFRNAVPDDVAESLELVHGTSEAAGLTQKVGKYLVPIERYREHAAQIESLADQTFLKYGPQHRETPATFEMENWLELVGWYVTEGSVDEANGRITLHQEDEDGRAAIRSLLERMDVNHNVGPRGINVSNRYLVEWFEEHCGNGYAEKRLPEWVFDLDGDLCATLLETMVDGDGSRTESGLRKFWTKSDDLKDGIVDIAVRAGHKPTVSKQNDGTWYVSIGKRGSFEKATNATVEPHDGQVHCVTAEDNHVVLAGRNGHFQWVGQSLYPMSMATINASPETKVDPDQYDGETYRAPDGTRFRKEPDGMMREMIDALLSEREQKKAERDQFDPDSAEYKRYDQQQAAVKRVMNCFTPDTDVLTPEGIVGITDIEVGDEVYSLNPDTLEMERKPVAETHAYPDYDGDLVDIQTGKVDLGVTPNHRMLVRKAETNGVSWDDDDYRFVEARDLDDATNYQLPHDWDGPAGERLHEVDLTELLDVYEVWANNEVHGHTLASEIGWYPNKVEKNDVDETGYVFSTSEFEEHRVYLDEVCTSFSVHAEADRKWIPRFYDGDDFLELLAWYVTEGSVYTSETKEFGDKLRGSATTVSIAQDAPTATDGGATVAEAEPSESDHGRIGDLLDRMGFDYYVDGEGYQFTSRLLGEYLEGACGADSFEKRVPELVFETSREQKRAFLDTLIAGDGDRQENPWRYSTASERLRDDVLRLCAHLGLTASYSEDSGVYRIYVSEGSKNTLRMHRSAERSTAEDGVYCVTVADNHTLLAGRNGTFQFVGQSLYGVSGWEQFRLYDKDAAAAITATGRSVIEFTEEVSSEMGYQVAYGDSVTGDRPVVVRDPEGLIRVLPIEELFERGAPVSDQPLAATPDGGSVTRDSAPKQRRTLTGWEALSMNDDGEPEWQPIEQAIRHETDKSVVKLQHKFGESTTTRDHSYVVDDDGEFVETAPEDVDRPHRISGIPAVETIEEIDVYEILDGYTREYEDGRSVGTENAETKTKRVCTDGDWVWFGHEHHDRQDKTVKVKRHVDLTDEDGAALVRLLAAYVTEGSASTQETTDSRFGASIAESRRDWLEGLQKDYHRLFDGTTASIVESDARDGRTVAYETQAEESTVSYEDRTLKLQMMNELAAVFFREFAGQRSRGKRIPSFVYHLSDDLQALFLDVLIEGDGYTDFPRYRDSYCERHFEYETVSRELAAGLSTLLNQRDKRHSLKYRDDKDSYSIRTCDYYREGRDPVLREVNHDGYVYDLSVAENENFVDGIGGIVLHNTDSVMLELGADVTTEEAIESSFDIEEAINARYDDYAMEELNAATHRFQIEFEKLYRRFFQAGKKKRYAGHIVWKEGKEVDDVDITGFEYKRSDIAGITKEIQHRVIELLVREGDVEGVKEYVHDTIEEFKQGNLPLDEVGIPGGIGKKLDAYETDTAQVRGAKYANAMLGTNFASGSKPMRLYVESVHPDFWRRMEDERGLNPGGGSREDRIYREFKRDPDVICFEYADQVPEEFDVDWDKMLEKTLKGPIARILEALDVSWDEVETGQEQTGLGNFM
jgi:DNA polymerase I